ncbi:MAG: metal-sensitive transcriptional regulator [Dehalococcoidia bacterium]
MDEKRDESEALLARLRRIEGQIRGIQRMLEEGRECEDVLTQLMAARSGLDQAGLLVMDRHVEQCLLTDMPDNVSLRNLQRALRMWLRFGSPSGPGENSGQ